MYCCLKIASEVVLTFSTHLYIHLHALFMHYYAYFDKKGVLQYEYSQPPILPLRYQTCLPFTAILILHLFPSSTWTVCGPRYVTFRVTSGWRSRSFGRTWRLTTCCVRRCTTRCSRSSPRPTTRRPCTRCPPSSSECSTTQTYPR